MTSDSDVLVSVVDSEDGFAVAEVERPAVGWDVIDIAGGHDGYVDVRLRYGDNGVVSVEVLRAGRVVGSLDVAELIGVRS